MCGIIGFTGGENAVPKLLDGLCALEYRGYDSAGIAVFDEKKGLCTVKAKGRLTELRKKLDASPLCGSCGIGHTRWATHGEPSDTNSHPHGTGRVFIVHNGIIENYASLGEYLRTLGYTFVSETDSERAACLIDHFYGETGDPVQALRMAAEKFTGSFAIGAVFADHPNEIYAMRKDNPLILAVSDKGNFVASDIPAVLKYTNAYYRLEQGEIAQITPESIIITRDGARIERALETVDWSMEAAEKGGYAHFMLKEIYESPTALVNTLRPRIVEGLPSFRECALDDERLCRFERIHVAACGTAMHAGLVAKYAIEKLARIPVEVEIASEFRYKDPILGQNDLVILISQSGETADTLAALRLAKERGVYTLALVNAPGSTIAREADCVLYTYAGPEIAVASTKAYTVQAGLVYLLALRLALAHKTKTVEEVKVLTEELLTLAPQKIELSLKNEEQCASLAARYKQHNDIFFIGRGIDYALCMEASLKLKEISYIHCEAYAAGELKHGTISLVTDGTPVFALATENALFDKMISNIREVRARGARVILLCDEKAVVPEDAADEVLRVPTLSGLFMPLSTVTLAQLIAYHFAVELDCDVDKPRNLAKSVTVE